MIDSKILKSEESAMLSLRSLYKQFGYLPFKMSKFEEYDLYVRNKEFLVSENVITFNDTDGRLLALKPDVTLSIIKNGADKDDLKHKVYYNENVYRVSGSTHLFKEIMQSGIECSGDIDMLDQYEVLYLAAKSLSLISDNFVLDLSHMGILSAVLDNASDDENFKREALKLISDKNSHDTLKLCKEYSVSDEMTNIISVLINSYGSPSEVLATIKETSLIPVAKEAYGELCEICNLLSKTEFYDKIKLDFSLVNNMNYYNGLVFKGFLSGICEGVLSGGEYDILMKRMGRDSRAIGFAIYLDLLENLKETYTAYDIDTLLLYDADCDYQLVICEKNRLISEGKSVLSETKIPKKLRFKEVVDIRKGGSE